MQGVMTFSFVLEPLEPNNENEHVTRQKVIYNTQYSNKEVVPGHVPENKPIRPVIFMQEEILVLE